MNARDLRRRVHDRRARAVLHALTWDDRADLPFQDLNLFVVGRDRFHSRVRDFPRQAEPLVVRHPGLERKAPARLEIGRDPVQLHDGRERRRDVGDVDHHRSLRRGGRVLGREDPVHAETLHEPAFLVLRLVPGARHRPRVADRSRQLGFPAPDHAGDRRLAEVDAVLVVAARLDVQDRGLAARIIPERVRKVARREVDVDVLPGRDQGRRAPTSCRQVLSDGTGEPARIREDRNGALDQHFLGVVAPERAADADAVPGVRHPKAVPAEDVDAVRLAEGTDLARVVHRALLGREHDLAKVRVDADELRNTVADAGRRR